MGFKQTVKVFPTKEDLDRIGGNYPILLLRTCGHIGVANSIALGNVGITKDTFVEGGDFLKDDMEPKIQILQRSMHFNKPIN